MGIYEEWKTKLHYKALLYLSNPSEIYNSAETDKFFILFSIFIILFLLSNFLYRKWIFTRIDVSKIKVRNKTIFGLLMPVFIVIGARGGLQEIPINQSESYYSKHNLLNLASVNSGFNIYVSIYENLNSFGKNPYSFFEYTEAHQNIADLHLPRKDSTMQILNTDRPNIVLLILESWSATLVHEIGGRPGISPAFSKLSKDGILFTDIYSSGARSEQGIASILSGFPAHPISSITIQPNKFQNLHTITHSLKNEGYSSSFLFGGQLIYGNIKSYIFHNDFDTIKEGVDFSGYDKGKLGIHDKDMMNELISQNDHHKQPFFSALFTLSTHSPFDMPEPLKKVEWGNELNEYLNSAKYTDEAIGELIDKARKSEWYQNTLFIIVADHSHHSYTYDPFHSKAYHQIPLLFYGDVIKDEFKGKQISKIGNHHDIPTTLLNQLGLETKEFYWSKDLLNPTSRDYAYLSFEEGVGWVKPEGQLFYDTRFDHFYINSFPSHMKLQAFEQAKSYLQCVFQDYTDR